MFSAMSRTLHNRVWLLFHRDSGGVHRRPSQHSWGRCTLLTNTAVSTLIPGICKRKARGVTCTLHLAISLYFQSKRIFVDMCIGTFCWGLKGRPPSTKSYCWCCKFQIKSFKSCSTILKVEMESRVSMCLNLWFAGIFGWRVKPAGDTLGRDRRNWEPPLNREFSPCSIS